VTYYSVFRCHGWTTHTQRVLVVFNKFDTGRSQVLTGLRKKLDGCLAESQAGF
jgi:hypothetical protein